MIGFGQFGKRNLGIVSTSDTRLVYIDPTSEVFFDNVLGCTSTNEKLKDFIEAVKEVKEAQLLPFWKPIYDPSLEGEKVVFKAGNKPAIGYSFNFWEKKVKEMPTVDGKNWSVGSEYQYYAFLVWLINQLVKKGRKINEALKAVVINSKELGNYWNSENSPHDFEKTGSREVCGVYDLANTCKLLSYTNEKAGGFWVAGGVYLYGSKDYPLADLYRDDCVDNGYFGSVGWLVLS